MQGEVVCGVGYRQGSPGCSQCADGYFANMNSCQRCPAGGLRPFTAVVVASGIVVAVLTLLYLIVSGDSEALRGARRGVLTLAWWKLRVTTLPVDLADRCARVRQFVMWMCLSWQGAAVIGRSGLFAGECFGRHHWRAGTVGVEKQAVA